MKKRKRRKKKLIIDKERLKRLVKGYKQKEEYLDHLRRLKAEFDNYKKRIMKEREELLRYANEDLIKELLPVIDNLERALNEESQTHNFESFREGILLIKKQILDILIRKGLKEIESVGKPLDPALHHAMMQRNSNQYQEDIIIEELQKGYLLHDRVIRPSQVIVSSGKE
jgi:molecular chaperone GrpE